VAPPAAGEALCHGLLRPSPVLAISFPIG